MKRTELTQSLHEPEAWQQACGHLTAVDPKLASLIEQHPKQALGPSSGLFAALSHAILGQQLSVKAAATVTARVKGALGGWSAELLQTTSEETLRTCGLSRQKAKYIKGLADNYDDLMNIDFPRLSDQEAIAALTHFKGVGPWTAEMVLMFHLGRPDIFPIGDIGIQRALRENFDVPKCESSGKISPESMLARAEDWRPWRTVAAWYLWRSLEANPIQY